ncbi:MAG TPA: NnrS family protein [Gammaproteobacteria bacterium]|nr:NnrS family protein [Gammaproteobacteria bacterium]
MTVSVNSMMKAGALPIVTAAPHRLFFLAGAAQLVVALLFWLATLAGGYIPGAPAFRLAIFGGAAHIFLMLYGLFTFFVFGFLTTTFPRWLNTEPIARGRYVTIATAMVAGMACYYGGLFAGRTLAIGGVAVYVAGWIAGLATLLQVWLRSDKADKRFVLFPFGCVSAGCAGAIVYAWWLATQQPELLTIATTAGFWLYLVPLIVAVSYRMIPFFSSRVLDNYAVVKPGWTLPATLACVIAHFALTIGGRSDWTVFCDLPLALLAAWHAWRWQLVRSLRVPLLGMLHVSFAWLAIAMGLFAAQSVLRLTDASFDLGLAPLHALGIGYITGMAVAMASRVSLGHSGRPLVAGWAVLWTFLVVQLAAIARVLAEFPPFQYHRTGLWLILAAAAIWLIAFIPWSVRFGIIYLRPRIDGRPG